MLVPPAHPPLSALILPLFVCLLFPTLCRAEAGDAKRLQLCMYASMDVCTCEHDQLFEAPWKDTQLQRPIGSQKYL